MERIRVTLAPSEYTALARLAERELRPVPDEIRAIVRERLREAGLLIEDSVSRPAEVS